MSAIDPETARGVAHRKSQPALPIAVLKPERRFSLAWLLPVLALLLAGGLAYKAWLARGISVTVQLDNGHGLKAGDEVRYRGIHVGKVDAVQLSPHLQGVIVTARLTRQSQSLARTGSRFWVVRPQLHLTRVEGLETLIGPRFLAVLPGPDSHKRHRQREFVGLSDPPVVEAFQSGDLEIILQSRQRGSLHRGAPVTYRQTPVGTVLSVGLAGDGGTVEARVHVQQPFVQLIRPQTRFWDVGGLQANLGLTGISIEIDSAEALLSGGVALATPPPDQAGGDGVRTGHRFNLASHPEDDWLDWQPLVAIGNALLPPGVSPPSPLRAAIGWKQGRIGRWIKGRHSRHGWVLQTPEGLLGPADLFNPSEKADRETIVLEVAGVVVPLDGPLLWEQNGLALLKVMVSSTHWPGALQRALAQPEECLAIGDPAADPLPLAVSRLKVEGAFWRIDPAIPIDEAWHGACVVSRADGKLLGLVLVEENGARIAPLPHNHDPAK